jgi:photosystem I subunit 2
LNAISVVSLALKTNASQSALFVYCFVKLRKVTLSKLEAGVYRNDIFALDIKSVYAIWEKISMSEEQATATFTAPKPTGKTPIWGGSTGGLLNSAFTEEKYLISWNSPKEQVFEMPTGGAATMVSGDNLLYLAKKEQALALGRQLRKFKITNYKIWREFPNGDQVYLHPADGVFPEKVNAGRVAVSSVSRKIGDNPNPISVKFTGKETYDV